MDKDGWLSLDDDSGRKYYFNSAFHAIGATKIDGSYYFFRINSGEMVRNESLFVPKGNSAGLEAGIYSFGEDGIMTTVATTAEEITSSADTKTETVTISGFENYVQSTSVLAINTTAPILLPKSSDGEDDSDDEQ